MSVETLSRQQLRAWLEREMALGLEAVPRRFEPRLSTDAPAIGESDAVRTASDGPAAMPPSPAIAATAGASALSEVLVEKEIRTAASLADLREVLGDCRRCKLCRGRTNIVFGVGNPCARLMFVGEGPGEDEDQRGEPFVGKAGALLTDIIVKGMGLRREDVYIANVVKCRPPNNRDPEPDEIVECEPFLRRQIELVRPEVLVSLGKFATQALLGDRTPISRRRGQWFEYAGTPLMPTFHPAYLLRNPSDKRLVWQDIQLVMARLGIALPSKERRP